MANERFGDDRYAKIGILTGLNYAAQGIGSIVISPLIKRLPTRIVLCAAVVLFGVVSAMILIIDAATGGAIKFNTTDNVTQYGHWSPNGVSVVGQAGAGWGTYAPRPQSSFPFLSSLACPTAWSSSFGV